MALKVKNYELSDGSLLEEAYLKVQSVGISNTDYEYFENNPNVELDGIEQTLKWITRTDSNATVYVWSDEIARRNNAIPVHWFKVDFHYDLSKYENVFEQAYKKLNILFTNSENY